MTDWLQKQWLRLTYWHLLLIPLSWFFAVVVNIRRWLYKINFLKNYRLDVPVIVVGNINIGGTGKTPLVIWLVEQLKRAGFEPGVISRGYGASVHDVSEVFSSSNALEMGDEPVLIAMRANCPVFVGVNRIEVGQALLKAYPQCNIIISDDGLQHYRMQRDVEIVVYDGVKRFGNGALLPAGPLRESTTRLKTVDAIVSNGNDANANAHVIEMQLLAADCYQINDPHKKCDFETLKTKKILAVAGIGNPDRFFLQLRNLGLNIETRAFPDHHIFQVKDLEDTMADVVLMTEKDAVKCLSFAKQNFFAMPVSAVIKQNLMAVILAKLNKLG